jgi:hypothetical protein
MVGNWSRDISLRFAAGALGGVMMLFCAGIAGAQAPPGPISGAPPAASDQPVGRPAPPPNNRWKNPDKPNLAGAWKLNQDESDDPRQRARQSSGTSGGGMGGQHGGWGVGGPGGVGVYHGGHGQNQSQNQAESMMSDFATLTIEQTDTTVRIRNYGNQVVAQYPMSAENSNDKDAKNNASDWQAGQLVVVTPSKNGGKITRRYTLSADGEQLFVTTRIDKKGSDPPVMFRFVYDPVGNNAQDQ